jgi:phosphatidylethanolamine-binding protein (PEBP) family uncharacterized protein
LRSAERRTPVDFSRDDIDAPPPIKRALARSCFFHRNVANIPQNDTTD